MGQYKAREPQDIHQQFAAAYAARDEQGLLSLYEEQAVMVPAPGAAPVQGRDAIRQANHPILEMQAKFSIETKSVVRAGELALLRSAWRLEGRDAAGQPVSMAHNSVEVVRRQADGTWLFVIDNPFGAD